MNKKNKYVWIFNLIFAIGLILYISYNLFFPTFKASYPNLFIEKVDSKYTYIPLGDSYSIGEGAGVSNSWSAQLVNQLKDDGIDIEIVSNPSKTGFTTFDLINYELPIFYKANPNFVTIMIGVNDYVQGIDIETFETNLEYIVTEVLKTTPKRNVYLINIPDFSKTPNGNRYSSGRDVEEGLIQFNFIIEKVATNNNITLIDIFNLSQEIARDQNNLAMDKLHYSKEGYNLFKEKISLDTRDSFIK